MFSFTWSLLVLVAVYAGAALWTSSGVFNALADRHAKQREQYWAGRRAMGLSTTAVAAGRASEVTAPRSRDTAVSILCGLLWLIILAALIVYLVFLPWANWLRRSPRTRKGA